MTLKRMIDADKICVNLWFLRKSASAFHRYRCQLVVLPNRKIERGRRGLGGSARIKICVNLWFLRKSASAFHQTE